MTDFFNLPSKAGQDTQNQYLSQIAQHLGVTAGNLQDAINMANMANQAAAEKITDLETRFQTLTAEQQQDAEVIDARVSAVKSKTFASLDARFEETEQDIATHMADYTSAHGGTYHKNLLHNWDFRNPVNQRGFTSTTNAGYTIDRWRLPASEHTVEVVSDGIKLVASKNAGLNFCFAQYVENYSSFAGVPLTLSVHIVENTLTQGCALRWGDHGGPAIMGTGYFSFTFTPPSLSYVGLQFNNKDVDDGNHLIIDKMKLEIGNVSTLANEPPADYGEQLALCQRYALVLGTGSYNFRASAYDANAITFIIPTPVTMRINPTFVGTLTVMSAGVAQTGFTFSIYRNAGSLAIVASKPAHGLTDAWLNVSGNTLFSADL